MTNNFSGDQRPSPPFGDLCPPVSPRLGC